MKCTSKTLIEKFEHNGIRYRRVSNRQDDPAMWEFYNTGYGEHGWLPVKGNESHARGVIRSETLEKLYHNL